MTCMDCLYYEVCPLGLAVKGKTGTCLKFKNKADFVEVVRCKDCKYARKMVGGDYSCRVDQRISHDENDFCSYGERKDT